MRRRAARRDESRRGLAGDLPRCRMKPRPCPATPRSSGPTKPRSSATVVRPGGRYAVVPVYARTRGRYLEGFVGGVRGGSRSAMIKIPRVASDTDSPRRAARRISWSAAPTGSRVEMGVVGSVARRGRPRGRRDAGTSIGAASLPDARHQRCACSVCCAAVRVASAASRSARANSLHAAQRRGGW